MLDETNAVQPRVAPAIASANRCGTCDAGAACDARATIALIETGRGPVDRWPAGINSVLLRVGALFSRQARVFVCPWHQVVLSAGAAVIEGPALAIEGDRHELTSLPATPVDAMWYYPVADATNRSEAG